MSGVIDFSKFDQRRSASSWNDYAIDLTHDYPPVDFLLKYNGIGCIPRGDLQVITGKMKTGKTFAALSLEVALLRGEFMGFESPKENIRVLHIDTEQSAGNVVKKIKTAHTLCGWHESVNSERFQVLSLRECSYEDRIRITLEAVEQFRPYFVFIDGIRDLCEDFNDIGESAALVGELMRVSSLQKCAIMCVLHENKGDGNMRGHLGSELANKCSEAYQVTKKEDIISVEQTVCRNMPIEKWAFRIDDNGIPVPDFANTLSQVQVKRNSTLVSVFKDKRSYSYAKLVKEFGEIYGCGERTSKSHIANARADGFLIKDKNGFYSYTDFEDDENDIFK
ncbi:AAA family ATPase [Parabacteroides sp. PF5-9]|uniref:AAA family ATPase n=1 Tax=Parabacteroides sp. PF5-9 TaxID=1742404 RepID=UPI002476FE79|nr:AAA family ATPase [Parabacteroides sp. PF5-9]MDH6357616.1 hypothetical protein [Parabacteroides sp. PF5-9]